MKVSVTPTISVQGESSTDTLFASNRAQSMDGEGHETSGKADIQPSTSFAVPFGNVTQAAIAFVETSADCVLVLNGQDVALKVPAGGTKARFLLEGQVTSLSIRNPASSGDAIKVSYCIIGDLSVSS